ncbi:hypothetical protein RUM43_001294 [Polyplax serrata]|uniref:FLYWCH-type domain-containing protein n=1 Tax=Polyplax serrata TaxID=468196 RepID=A0AAN8SDL2_POLSC
MIRTTAMSSDHVEVIKSNKGHYKIIHMGFMYTKHKSFNNVTRWRCAARGICRGSIMTSNDFTHPTPKMAHTHPADHKACQVAKARYLIPKVNNFIFKKEHFQADEG